MIQLPEFKIRCSKIGDIMTNPRSKSDILSKTTMTYLDSWVMDQLYKRVKEIKSKYLDKGNIMEQDALDAVARNLDIGIILKNEEHYEDEFFTGTPDAVPNDVVIDTKCSWDYTTFPLLHKEIKDKDYKAQLQGYMHLTKKTEAKLVHVLLDTPMHLIEREARYYCLNNGYEPDDQDILADHVRRMTYGDLPDTLKYKSFDLAIDTEFLALVIERVKECRKYIEAAALTLNI